MKKFTIISMLLFATIFIGVKTFQTSNNVQQIKGTVIAIENDLKIIKTFDGNGWAIDKNNLEIEDNIIIVYDTLNDNNIYNDEIISIIKVNFSL